MVVTITITSIGVLFQERRLSFLIILEAMRPSKDCRPLLIIEEFEFCDFCLALILEENNRINIYNHLYFLIRQQHFSNK